MLLCNCDVMSQCYCYCTLGSEWKDDDYSSGDYDYSISDDDDDGDYGDDDKDSHQFKANLSEDLKRLLGLVVPSTVIKGGETKDFIPPQFYGLANSARKPSFINTQHY